MSTFLHNVVRRGAGLPVAAAHALPSAASATGTDLSGDALAELVSETLVAPPMAPASDAPATRAEPGAKPEPESSATPKPAPAAVSLSVTLTSVPRAIQRVAAEPRVPAHSTGTVEPGKPRVKEVGFVTPMPPLAPQNPIETMNVEAALEPPRGDISHAQDIQVSATSRQKSKVDETEVRRTVRVLQEQPHGQEVTLAIEPPDKLEGIFNNTARRQPLDDNAVPSATPAIRPRITETRIQLPVVKPATTLSAPPHVSPLPIHVRIGRVEVREAPAPGGTAPAPPPLGFAKYYRVRNYRGWK